MFWPSPQESDSGSHTDFCSKRTFSLTTSTVIKTPSLSGEADDDNPECPDVTSVCSTSSPVEISVCSFPAVPGLCGLKLKGVSSSDWLHFTVRTPAAYEACGTI